MRKVSMFLFVLVAFALSAMLVHAQVQAVDTFDKDHPNFGSKNQEASNPKDDDGAKDIFVDSIVRVKNTGSSSITINAISFTGKSGFTQNDIKVSLTEPALPFTVAAGEEKDLTFNTRIPQKLDAVNSDGDQVAFNVGSVNLLTGSSTPTGSFEVWMQREDNLEIKNFDAEINGRSKQSVDRGDKIDNLRPGDRVSFEVRVKNNFNDRSNIDVENVEGRFICDDSGDLDFSDESNDVGDIPTDQDETFTTDVDIESNAKDGTLGCTLRVIGTDQNGAKHGEARDFDFKVNRENHDIQIDTVTFNPNVINCGDQSVTMNVDVHNFGRSNERRVAVEVTSKAVGYQKRESDIELDEDDSRELSFEIPIPPEFNSQFGAFQIQTFFDNVRSSNTKVTQLENLCAEKKPVDNTGNTGNTGNENNQPAEALSLGTEATEAAIGGSISIPVTVKNNGNQNAEYSVSLEDISDFAEPSSPKTLFLNPGQSSTIFLNLKTKSTIDESKYSATVQLKSASGDILETKAFTVDVKGKAKAASTSSGLSFNTDATKVLWIVADIILVIVAIFFIRLIFVGGKKKNGQKMSDMEASTRKK